MVVRPGRALLPDARLAERDRRLYDRHHHDQRRAAARPLGVRLLPASGREPHVGQPALDRPARLDPLLLGALVGVVLDIYAAHILVLAIFGKMLHEREPSGRSASSEATRPASVSRWCSTSSGCWPSAAPSRPRCLPSRRARSGCPGRRSRPHVRVLGPFCHPQHGAGPHPVLAVLFQPWPASASVSASRGEGRVAGCALADAGDRCSCCC